MINQFLSNNATVGVDATSASLTIPRQLMLQIDGTLRPAQPVFYRANVNAISHDEVNLFPINAFYLQNTRLSIAGVRVFYSPQDTGVDGFFPSRTCKHAPATYLHGYLDSFEAFAGHNKL